MKNQATPLLLKAKAKTTIACTLIFCMLLNSCNRLPDATSIFKITDAPQLRLSYNSVTTMLDNGRRQTEFYTKWINYMDGFDKWKEIDPNFVRTGRGFEMTKAPFEVVAPFYADEEATFNNNNRYDVATGKIIYDKPLEQTMQALGTAHVAGQIETGDLGWGKAQYVVYPNAYPQYHADLIYWVHQGTEPRLRKFIRFNQKLSQNTDFKFRVVYSDAVQTVNNGSNVTVKLKNAKGNRGNGWEDFYIWDSKGGWANRTPIRFGFDKPQVASAGNEAINPNEYILTKHIEAAYFKTATLPVFTDGTSTFFSAAGTNTPCDGYIQTGRSSNDTWASVHDAASGDQVGTSDGTIAVTLGGGTVGGTWNRIERLFFLFNTSTIGAGAYVGSATL